MHSVKNGQMHWCDWSKFDEEYSIDLQDDHLIQLKFVSIFQICNMLINFKLRVQSSSSAEEKRGWRARPTVPVPRYVSISDTISDVTRSNSNVGSSTMSHYSSMRVYLSAAIDITCTSQAPAYFQILHITRWPSQHLHCHSSALQVSMLSWILMYYDCTLI